MLVWFGISFFVTFGFICLSGAISYLCLRTGSKKMSKVIGAATVMELSPFVVECLVVVIYGTGS